MPFGCRHKVLIFFLTANWGLLSATRGYIQALAMWPPPQDPLYFKSASSGRTPSPGLIKSGPLNKLTDLEPLKSLHLCHIALPNMIFRRRQWHPTPVLLPGKSHGQRSLVGCSPWVAKIRLSDFTFTFHFHALKEMATHSSVLAWRIPGSGEPGGLPSMGSHRVGHD